MHIEIFALVFTIFVLIYTYFKRAHNYWKSRGVAGPPPFFPFGTMRSVILRQQNLGDKVKEIYNEYKSKGHRFVGVYFFSRKVFVALDPSLVKNILIKDFNHFDDRGIYYDEINDPLSAHLFSLSGPKWRNLRAKLTPTFTSGKLKYMFQTFVNCSAQMTSLLESKALKGEEVEIKDILARFTTDVIGSTAFGLECNTMKNPNTQFREMGKRAFTQTAGDAFRVTVIRSFSWLAKLLKLGIFPSNVTKFFKEVVEETVTYREKNNITRKDFLQLLIQLKNNGKVDDDEKLQAEIKPAPGTSLTMNEAAAQAFIFFLAGFETTATTMSFALFEMAQNRDIQYQAREEVKKVMNDFGNVLTYDALMEMHYLDKIVAETLRKHPPAPVYLRKCTKDYQVPETDVIIEEGLSVLIPALALQRDPDYFPDPDVFDPNRFDDERKSSIKDSTYIPFGDGPRICIGLRFAMIQVKVGLSMILKNFNFTLSPKTPLPLVMETQGIITTPQSGIWLNLTTVN
ncbi:probable cytochrome P450 6a14 [Agrilus planipennis]|uniref:Probable cytochrome P450 6a14 n=1 Tax=Agrilus planipennis TaxID=224129 RepID=A0A1W4WJ93_AGRPL|nr:probable cytochrome P450 6a14 [Agrilus planipennis]